MKNITFSQLLERYPLSDAEIALLFSIPERTVRSWRLGQREPAPYVLLMMQYILGLHYEGGLVYNVKAADTYKKADR